MPHAVVATQAGGPEVLSYISADPPAPGPGQILLRVAAAGVNFSDTYKRRGTHKATYPYIPGSEAAGTVAAVGGGVVEFAEGDRVATAEGHHCYADYALVDADKAFPVPDEIDDTTAAALPMQGLTAHYLANSAFQIEAGQNVLLHAGGGGVGLLLIQLLKAKGARVITTVSSNEKETLAFQFGADRVVRYAEFATGVRDFTDGKGVEVVYDGVGKDTFDGSLKALAVRGTLVLFGTASGPVPPVDFQRQIAEGSTFLTVPSLASYLQNAEERRWRSAEIFAAAANHNLKVSIGATYRLSEAAEAHRDLEGRRIAGKGLLIP
ncbi:quinone oxidoreductase [Pseudarthrobacter sp. NPDC055928]|uniref:quinone oxidoreductase family protein n=1 Tax=Pseudarthrobacter sp. NPDC055928 TaxID=3345661 RepID=UPI0035E22779